MIREQHAFQVTAVPKGADVVSIRQDAGDKTAVAFSGRQKPEYDTSSGDSCWVRQYLEWNDPAGVDMAGERIGSKLIKPRRADAA